MKVLCCSECENPLATVTGRSQYCMTCQYHPSMQDTFFWDLGDEKRIQVVEAETSDTITALKHTLSGWTDADFAFLELSAALGYIERDQELYRGKYKHIGASRNWLHDTLQVFMDELVRTFTLEFRDHEFYGPQYRWRGEPGKYLDDLKDPGLGQ
jgi:antirestriction protein